MMFSLSAREHALDAFTALSGGVSPKELTRLFSEVLVPKMGKLCSEGHSPGSALAHLLANSSAFDVAVELQFPAADNESRSESGSAAGGKPTPAPVKHMTRARAAAAREGAKRQRPVAAAVAAEPGPSAAAGPSEDRIASDGATRATGSQTAREEHYEPTGTHHHYEGPIEVWSGTSSDGIPGCYARAEWWHPLTDPRRNPHLDMPPWAYELYRVPPS